MGSRSKNENDYAYIAGFLDGDGSLMLQVKKRGDTRRGIRLMATICFYQDTRHEEPLRWIRTVLGIGYLSRRRDGMSELRVNGFQSVFEVLSKLEPFIRFKRIQVKSLLQATDTLRVKKIRDLKEGELKHILNLIFVIQNQNYVTKKKKSKKELYALFGLTP